MTYDNLSPFIKICHFRIAGKCKRDVTFTDGLNIIESDNGLGKTTLLRLIQYGFGLQQPVHGSNWEKTLIPELKDSLAVFVELEANGQIFTLRRDINKNQDLEIVSWGKIDDILRREAIYNIKNREVSDFLLSRLGIPSIEIQSESEQSSKSMFLITDHLFKMMYLDQDVGYVALGNTLGERLRIASTELLLGIINTDYYDLEISEQLEKERKKRLQEELRYIENFLNHLDVLTLSEIENRRKMLLANHSQLIEQINKLKLDMRANPEYRSELREEFLEAERELISCKTRQIEIEQSLARFDLAAASVDQERERVQRASHAKTVLSRYTIEVCPGCNQTLTKEMHAHRFEGKCELCGREMPIIEDNSTDELEWRQKVLQDEKKEIEELRIKRQNELIQVKAQSVSLEHNRNDASEKLNTLREQYVTELINQIEEIRITVNQIEKELSLLDFQFKAKGTVERINIEILKVDDSLLTITKKKEIQKRQLNMTQQVINDLENALRAFLKAINFNNLDAVSIHSETYIPYVSGRSYRQLSTTQRDLVILGYYYALLRISLTRKTNFPRLLIIDTVRKDDIDQETLDKSLQQFDQLYELFGVPYQVIITMRETPPKFNRCIKLKLREKDYLLTC